MLEGPSVQEILELAEEILSRNQTFNAKYLYNEAKKRLKIDRKTILRTIQLLIEKRILIEGSKLTKDLVLLNPHRKSILEFIQRNLGANFSMIKGAYEGTTGSPGQLIWHLQMLLKFKYIKKIKYRRFTILIPSEVEEMLGVHFFILRNQLNLGIVKLFLVEDVIKKSDIYKHLNREREKINYRVNLLIEVNILCVLEEGENLITLNNEKREFLEQIINKLNKEGGN